MIIDFKRSLGGFEPNQKVTLSRSTEFSQNTPENGNYGPSNKLLKRNSLLKCVSNQDTSTPGIILKGVNFNSGNNDNSGSGGIWWTLEVDGWANCKKAFIQVICPESGNRLITTYYYLPTEALYSGAIKIYFQVPKPGKYNLAILFGGAEKVEIGDTFWITTIKLVQRDLDSLPPEVNTKIHNQDIVVRRDYDNEPPFQWTCPIELSELTITESSPSQAFRNSRSFIKTPFSQNSPVNGNYGVARQKNNVANVIEINQTGIFLSLESDGSVRWFKK